jgi:hypothetical protein
MAEEPPFYLTEVERPAWDLYYAALMSTEPSVDPALAGVSKRALLADEMIRERRKRYMPGHR